MKALFCLVVLAVLFVGVGCSQVPPGCKVIPTEDGVTIMCDNAAATVNNGTDGVNGTNGIGGSNGANGVNGVNGAPGEQGAPGATGLNTMVTMTPEPLGTHCVAGGTRVNVGLDADGNGALDVEEVSSTTYICNGPAVPAGTGAFHGQARIINEIEYQQMLGYSSVTTLFILDEGVVSMTFPNLEVVSGNLKVLGQHGLIGYDGAAALAELRFPALRSVGGYFHVAGLPSLTVFDAPMLTSVGGWFTADGCHNLPRCQIDAILTHTTVGGTIYIDSLDPVCD